MAPRLTGLLWLVLATASSEQLRRQRRRRDWRPRAGQMNVIIFGPPGVGKGTQSSRIQQAYGLCHVSTGDILRREIVKRSKSGLEAQRYVGRGEMVPDELIIRLVKWRVESAALLVPQLIPGSYGGCSQRPSARRTLRAEPQSRLGTHRPGTTSEGAVWS